MRIVDVLYCHELDVNNYRELFEKHAASMGHHGFLSEKAELHVIRHFNGKGKLRAGACDYHFFQGKASKSWMPFRLHKFINSLRPDVIIVHGFLNPLQVLLLKWQTNVKILLQYHGGIQPRGITGLLQKQANKYIDSYVFTAADQAKPFVQTGFISAGSKIFEVMEGSNDFQKMDKQTVRCQLNIKGQLVFLWVGTLDANKDPLTILAAFEELLPDHDDVHLYMIYHQTVLLPEVKSKIEASDLLKNKVHLVGKVSRQNIEKYFNSADFFLLGSHYEGSGYALCEALACGCIPIVTNIPSFRMMTDNGKLGALWECGNRGSLINAIRKCLEKPLQQESENCMWYFRHKLSFEAIAHKIWSVCSQITSMS